MDSWQPAQLCSGQRMTPHRWPPTEASTLQPAASASRSAASTSGLGCLARMLLTTYNTRVEPSTTLGLPGLCLGGGRHGGDQRRHDHRDQVTDDSVALQRRNPRRRRPSGARLTATPVSRSRASRWTTTAAIAAPTTLLHLISSRHGEVAIRSGVRSLRQARRTRPPGAGPPAPRPRVRSGLVADSARSHARRSRPWRCGPA